MMGKIFCTCGHAISFITDYLPFKGYILKDQDNDFFVDVAYELALLCQATSEAEKEEWDRRHEYLELAPPSDNKSRIFSISAPSSTLTAWRCSSAKTAGGSTFRSIVR